jgi:hypothetical protein
MQLGRRGIAVLDDAAGSDERQHEMDCHATLVAAQRRPAGARSAPVVDRRDPDFNEMILTHPALRLTTCAFSQHERSRTAIPTELGPAPQGHKRGPKAIPTTRVRGRHCQ